MGHIRAYTFVYVHACICLYISPFSGVRIKNSVCISSYIFSKYVRILKVYTSTRKNIRTQTYMHVYCLYSVRISYVYVRISQIYKHIQSYTTDIRTIYVHIRTYFVRIKMKYIHLRVTTHSQYENIQTRTYRFVLLCIYVPPYTDIYRQYILYVHIQTIQAIRSYTYMCSSQKLNPGLPVTKSNRLPTAPNGQCTYFKYVKIWYIYLS